MKQRTLLREVTAKGNALHTGDAVHLTFKPAPVNHGIVFKRTDLHGQPEIKPRIELVTDLVRATTIQQGHAKVHTVEHVLSALSGCGVDNLLIEMDASEPPILDGSAREFVKMIQQGEPVEQDAEREYFVLTEPISVSRGNSSVIALPFDGLKISCTSADDRGIHTQHLSLTIDPDVYVTQVAAARTFTVYEDIEELIKLGKIKGGSLDNAVVIKGDKIISKEPLRFQDEFVRHKILDLVGDITLLGMPLRAHLVATRPGHAINAELTRVLFEKLEQWKKGGKKPVRAPSPKTEIATETSMDTRRVLDLLPHRYPFVMIDRVVEAGVEELTAIKNVTINEPFFQGHYPGNPVMPGVLQIEAMAQAAGIMLIRRTNMEGKTALFMSCDKVKWRRPVRPGDQLNIKVKITRIRGSIVCAEGECTVNNQVVCSADLMFTTVDTSQLD
ncbi:MAG TPA: bifunctional UDP-3-O-[3-hydroxymyristoyl] N-acetylglucosamine deacetylase/3-hydroxyacyl-ACP dehydratase [Candidatus Didemnitutus sp.]|jgi:UDP-3-O-[3-hydroxymyristoyl] N-acetylglucosamine deacetylase/3-hydroxyacyl-[acyl-carrier-protein] dehydratase